MKGISELRRGRRLQFKAKRLKLRRRQPRYAGQSLRSAFKAAPRNKGGIQQPYLSAKDNLSDIL